ncbi:MAG TPA: hypothetical protein VLE47_04130 [Candidatus Saccharimonadales bacterium]|nr:hypothetical protein [Candidatus Saccharimonadales bacterium]
MSKEVDRIVQARNLVRQAESGEIEWAKLVHALGEQFMWQVPVDSFMFVAEVYFRFRLTEAVTYHFRKGNEGYPYDVDLMIDLCETQRERIGEALQINEALVPSTPAEEYAKLTIEEILLNALKLFGDFKAWGY